MHQILRGSARSEWNKRSREIAARPYDSAVFETAMHPTTVCNLLSPVTNSDQSQNKQTKPEAVFNVNKNRKTSTTTLNTSTRLDRADSLQISMTSSSANNPVVNASQTYLGATMSKSASTNDFGWLA